MQKNKEYIAEKYNAFVDVWLVEKILENMKEQKNTEV